MFSDNKAYIMQDVCTWGWKPSWKDRLMGKVGIYTTTLNILGVMNSTLRIWGGVKWYKKNMALSSLQAIG